MAGRRTDTATRVIAASPQAIYRAFLDPDAWVKWIPPEGMVGHIYAFEPRPGGAYRMALTYSKGAPRIAKAKWRISRVIPVLAVERRRAHELLSPGSHELGGSPLALVA
jgi:uncharacterized protein YndB with AHSA1/START domain